MIRGLVDGAAIVSFVAVMEEVARWQGVRFMKLPHVGAEEERARQRHAHHLMRVDGDRVREMRAGELVRVLRREDGGPAPGGVDVEPEVVVGLADLGEGGEGVVGA